MICIYEFKSLDNMINDYIMMNKQNKLNKQKYCTRPLPSAFSPHSKSAVRAWLRVYAPKTHTIYYPPGLLSVPESTLYTIHRTYY